jgi:hypothetical protein
MGQVSLISVLAGTLVAFASFAILLAIIAGVLAAVGIDTESLTSNDYREIGIGAAVMAGLVLFLSYFFGGYIAGRLARRAGALNGGLVLAVALLIGAVVALVVGTQADTEAVAADLRIVGVPTSGADFGSIATIAGLVSLAAMLAGSVLGGLTGERWHGKLATRAFNPDIGPEAAARQEMIDEQQRRQQEHLRPDPAPAPAVTPAWTDDASTTARAGTTGSVVTTEPQRRERPLRSDSPRREQ